MNFLFGDDLRDQELKTALSCFVHAYWEQDPGLGSHPCLLPKLNWLHNPTLGVKTERPVSGREVRCH